MEPQNKDDEKAKIRFLFIAAGIIVLAAACIILIYFGVKRYDGLSEGWSNFLRVWQAIIFGFIIAFLLNPIMKFFDRHLINSMRKACKTEEKAKKTSRLISTLIALVIGIGIVVLILVAVIPQLYQTIVYLVNHLAEQIDGVLDWANEITGGRYEKAILGAKGSKVNEAIDTALEWVRTQILSQIDLSDTEGILSLVSNVVGIGRVIVNIIVGLFVSVYVLIDKEKFKGQAKKVIYGILKTSYANKVVEVCRKAKEIFYGFIIGKIIDSAIIGVICYISMLILQMPYPLLVSVIIGLTNIIPVFGPYIGAVPTVIIIFLTSPMQGIYFLIYIIVLQQFDGNLIGPKILGDSTGLSSLWVVVAIVVGGGLFGIVGMLIGVPIMALIYYICSEISKYLLRRKGLPEETEDYINLEHIDVDSKEIVEHEPGYAEKKMVKPFANKKRKHKS